MANLCTSSVITIRDSLQSPGPGSNEICIKTKGSIFWGRVGPGLACRPGGGIPPQNDMIKDGSENSPFEQKMAEK